MLPRIILDYHIYMVWTHLDLESLDQLGIKWRETNWPSNPKSWYNSTHPFRSVARAALTADYQLLLQYGDDQPIHRWQFEADKHVLDVFLASLSQDANLTSAEVLFVNPSFIRMHFPGQLITRVGKKKNGSPAEAMLYQVYRRLRWCGQTLDLNKPAYNSMIHFDCYSRGAEAQEFS